MNILIKNVQLDMKPVDIYIRGNRIEEIGRELNIPADKIIDGTDKAVIPGMVNAHTHAAMTLFRGFGDDMPLMSWLQDKIWPNEAKLTAEDIYWGTKLACLEMIKSGTTAFVDMYFKHKAVAKAVEEMGIRASVAITCMDQFKDDVMEQDKRKIEHIFSKDYGFSDRITLSVGPHAIYTVSGKQLQWVDQFAKDHDLIVTLHLAETEGEVQNALKDFGATPVRYLKNLGILSPRLILAHVLHLDDEEIQILADSGAHVVHNPASNLKLASGDHFKFDEMRKAGVNVGLGTDGCASSNNLDMVEVMRLASLLGKAWRRDPLAVSAQHTFEAATYSGAKMLRLNAGRMEKGYLADLCLVNLLTPAFTPNFNFVSNLVYSADGSCIDTVICDGKVLMENRRVEGEEEILRQAAQSAYNLINR